jgi:outer membrane protein
VNEEALQLTWVLFDFGGRSAAVKNSRQLLLAAQANQSSILQSAFANTAKDYYAAQAAAARVQSARRIEAGSQKNLDAAGARYKSGVVPITDQFQANTAYAQAVYERAAAEGAYRLAMGQLAVDMSLPPDELLPMPEMDTAAQPDVRFVHAVHDLLEQASHDHPAILAAKAQWQASLDNVDAVRAQGLPKLSLTGSVDRASQPLNTAIGTLNYPSVSRTSNIGVQLQVPLFSGFNQSYKVKQAQAVADQQEQQLRDTQQQVALSVWTNYQILTTDTENLKNTDVVQQSATQAFTASSQRYQSGVGNILELLNSQGTLAGAEQQRIQAQLEWRTARLALAASLGSLGAWAVK